MVFATRPRRPVLPPTGSGKISYAAGSLRPAATLVLRSSLGRRSLRRRALHSRICRSLGDSLVVERRQLAPFRSVARWIPPVDHQLAPLLGDVLSALAGSREPPGVPADDLRHSRPDRGRNRRLSPLAEGGRAVLHQVLHAVVPVPLHR